MWVDLSKVSSTFPAAIFSVDARVGRKDEKPYKLIE